MIRDRAKAASSIAHQEPATPEPEADLDSAPLYVPPEETVPVVVQPPVPKPEPPQLPNPDDELRRHIAALQQQQSRLQENRDRSKTAVAAATRRLQDVQQQLTLTSSHSPIWRCSARISLPEKLPSKRILSICGAGSTTPRGKSTRSGQSKKPRTK